MKQKHEQTSYTDSGLCRASRESLHSIHSETSRWLKMRKCYEPFRMLDEWADYVLCASWALTAFRLANAAPGLGVFKWGVEKQGSNLWTVLLEGCGTWIWSWKCNTDLLGCQHTHGTHDNAGFSDFQWFPQECLAFHILGAGHSTVLGAGDSRRWKQDDDHDEFSDVWPGKFVTCCNLDGVCAHGPQIFL